MTCGEKLNANECVNCRKCGGLFEPSKRKEYSLLCLACYPDTNEGGKKVSAIKVLKRIKEKFGYNKGGGSFHYV